MKLTWPDLIIENITSEEAEEWIQPWRHLLSGRWAPVFMSKFGDWFIQRPDGSREKLSVIEGTLEKIASTHEEFAASVNDVEWQEEHLLSSLVVQLHRRGMKPGDGQCYGFAPHPAFTGNIDIESVQVMSIPIWQSFAAQALS